MAVLSQREVLQVNGFKAIFKTAEGTCEERFATAITATSDDVFRRLRAADPRLVEFFWQQRKRGASRWS